MSTTHDFDPNNNDEVEGVKGSESATLGLVTMKLNGIIKTLPAIAANDQVRAELKLLQQNVTGSYNRIKGEIQAQRRAGLGE